MWQGLHRLPPSGREQDWLLWLRSILRRRRLARIWTAALDSEMRAAKRMQPCRAKRPALQLHWRGLLGERARHRWQRLPQTEREFRCVAWSRAKGLRRGGSTQSEGRCVASDRVERTTSSSN